MIHSKFINSIGIKIHLNIIQTITMLVGSILKYWDVTCLFNQKVHRYATVDMKCQMPDNNVR